MKIVVYSCVIGKIDVIKKIKFKNNTFDYVMFTDRVVANSNWDAIEQIDCSVDNRMTARYYKHNPRLLFPKYDITIWIDGTHSPKSDLTPLLSVLGEKNIAVSRHPLRNNIKNEAEICAKLNLDKKENLQNQIKTYENNGFLDNEGLFETCYLVRKNNTESQELEKKWWEHITTFSIRDQISLPYCLWELNEKPATIPGFCRMKPNDLFEYYPHRTIKI